MQKSYYVAAIWDAEAEVWISDSNIPGLVIEADSLAEFEDLMISLAPELLAANEDIHNTRVPVSFRVDSTRELAVGA